MSSRDALQPFTIDTKLREMADRLGIAKIFLCEGMAVVGEIEKDGKLVCTTSDTEGRCLLDGATRCDCKARPASLKEPDEFAFLMHWAHFPNLPKE